LFLKRYFPPSGVLVQISCYCPKGASHQAVADHSSLRFRYCGLASAKTRYFGLFENPGQNDLLKANKTLNLFNHRFDV
jgi:hypothetical protein